MNTCQYGFSEMRQKQNLLLIDRHNILNELGFISFCGISILNFYLAVPVAKSGILNFESNAYVRLEFVVTNGLRRYLSSSRIRHLLSANSNLAQIGVILSIRFKS